MPPTLQELVDQRAQVLNEIDEILDTAAQNMNRALTREEADRHDALVRQHDQLTRQIDDTPGAQQWMAAQAARTAGLQLVGVGGAGRSDGPQRIRRPGEPLVLERSESLVEALRSRWEVQPEELSIGHYVRGMVTGRWDGAERELEVMRAQSVAPLPSGGFFVPEALSASLIDLARNQTRVVQAGARTVEMPEATFHMARVKSDPPGQWLNENATAIFSEGSYERITFVAKTLRAYTKASVELIEDAEGIAQVITDQLSASLALELDRAALRGSGAGPEPRGMRNHDDINGLQVLNAAPTNYDFLSTAIQTIRQANGDPNAAIMSPRTSGVLDRLKDTTNQPLVPPPSVQALMMLVTNQIPETLGDGSNDTELYVGDWSQLMIGIRTDLTIEVERAAADGTSGAFTDFQVWIRAYLRGDIQLARPKHFVAVTEIEP